MRSESIHIVVFVLFSFVLLSNFNTNFQAYGMDMMDVNSHVCKSTNISHPFQLKTKSQNVQFSMLFLGNDEVVKALIFDGVVTNDFENQKSPRGRGGMA